MKVTKKIEQDLIDFNRRYRKPNKERPLTIDEYVRYLYGKGLPTTVKKSKPARLKPRTIPTWAIDPYQYPSVQDSDYHPTRNSIMDRLDRESEETRAEILRKKNRIALPYSKGAYQYVNDESIVTCLGRKL